MAYKDFAPAQILTAQEVDTYLMRQSIMVFATITARDAAITTPTEGMVTYQQDTKLFSLYNGTAWASMGTALRFASAAARTSALPSPVEGMISYLQDTDELQIYNGASWLTVVVTSDDEGFTTTGAVNAVSGGVDGGLSLRTWTGNANYLSLATTSMASAEYIVVSDGTDTFVSTGAGGSVAIRPSANDSAKQLLVTSSAVSTASDLTVNTSGPAGGLQFKNWPGNPTLFNAITTSGASTVPHGFMMMTDGNSTHVGPPKRNGTNGYLYLYGGSNSNPLISLGPDGNIGILGRVTRATQPYTQLYSQNIGFQALATGVIGAGNPPTMTWVAGTAYTAGWDGASSFVAPATGVYLCCFKAYQYHPSGTGYVHWVWQVGGSISWNGGRVPYNIYGYNVPTGGLPEGVDIATLIYVTQGNGIQMRAIVGGTAPGIYTEYTYMSFYYLG
jgi:hypothetical protein